MYSSDFLGWGSGRGSWSKVAFFNYAFELLKPFTNHRNLENMSQICKKLKSWVLYIRFNLTGDLSDLVIWVLSTMTTVNGCWIVNMCVYKMMEVYDFQLFPILWNLNGIDFILELPCILGCTTMKCPRCSCWVSLRK